VEKNKNEQFLQIFNDLAEKKAFSIVQMCSFLNISRTLIYEIRDGTKVVSDKTWNKVKKAERESASNMAIIEGSSLPESVILKRLQDLEESHKQLRSEIAKILRTVADHLTES